MSQRSRVLIRTIRVIQRLLRGPVVVERLAADLKVHPRTVYRDLNALEELHLPLIGAAEGGYRLLAGTPCPVCGHEGRR